MTRPTPTGKEILFGFDEMFFSRTDQRGVILFGNDVFVRIAAYPRETLEGAPHSIIRHPDMPRCVFRLFWQMIQAGKPIAAYVKNLAADGSHYWVLGVAFPVGNEYLSIRIRPSSPLLEAARAVYEKVLEEEDKFGMDAATALLVKMLGEAGFTSYESFMTAALNAELRIRDKAIAGARATDENQDTENDAAAAAVLATIRDVTSSGWEKYNVLDSRILEFESASRLFNERTTALLDSFKRIQVVSLNVTVYARQVGEIAVALGVISKEFHRLALEIERNVRELDNSVQKIGKSLTGSSFDFGALKMQMGMVDFFVRESLAKIETEKLSITEAFRPLEMNCEHFSGLAANTRAGITTTLASLRNDLRQFESAIDDISRFVSMIEIITQMAALESARIQSMQEAFGSYLQQMEQFNGSLKSATEQIAQTTKSLLAIIHFIEERLPEVSGTQDRIFELAFSLKSQEGL